MDVNAAVGPCDIAASATGSKSFDRGIEVVDDDDAVLEADDVAICKFAISVAGVSGGREDSVGEH